MRVKLLKDIEGAKAGDIVTMAHADAEQRIARGEAADLGEASVRVRFLSSVEPTRLDPQRYEAGSEWIVPESRAEELLAEELVDLVDLDAAPASYPLED